MSFNTTFLLRFLQPAPPQVFNLVFLICLKLFALLGGVIKLTEKIYRNTLCSIPVYFFAQRKESISFSVPCMLHRLFHSLQDV